MAGTRIHWNPEEVTVVANATKVFWATAPGMTMLEAVRGGQNALPKERRRALTTRQQINPTVKLILEQFVKSGGLEPKREEPAAPAVAPVEPPKPAPTPLETALMELADRVADTVATRIADRLRQSLGQRMEGLLQHAAQAATHSDVQKKRKVLIIGLAEYLQHPIQQEFSKLLDIRFKTPDAPMNGIIDTAKGMDLVLQTKWSSHSVSDSLRTHGIEFVFVDGGVQALKEKLTEFYVL